ncbi:MAG: glutamate--tRNA ligase family protein, partial [Pseudomonadota bacterium]
SDRAGLYAAALDRLRAAGFVYPCFCSREEVRRELDAMFGAPHLAPQGPDGPLYPGRCRGLDPSAAQARLDAGAPCAWRLNVEAAAARVGPLNASVDGETRRADGARLGDVALARKDGAAAYHLAVVVDDAAQAVDLVTRGADLAPAADLHRLLDALLDAQPPRWRHHPLVRDEDGMRLAKRADSKSLAALRAGGETPETIRARLAPLGWP